MKTQAIHDSSGPLARWDEDGFAVLRGMVPKEACEVLRRNILAEHDRRIREGVPLAPAGVTAGHLNCYPGDEVKAILDAIETSGAGAMIDRILGRPRKLISIGCNVNLPGSHYQSYHADGSWDEEFLVVNVALEDISERNGSLDIVTGSGRRWMRYWQFILTGLHRAGIRCNMTQGDVVIRSSVVWHRGTANRAERLRPMLALIYNGPEAEATEYQLGYNGGKTKLMANRFEPGLKGKIKEFTHVRMPILHAMLRFAKSFTAPVGQAT